VENNMLYTEEQLMARLKFFVGICLALTLTGIVFVVLYSLIFVTQPLNAMSPIDQKFFEMIIPIATFLTGTLSGIMLAGSSKEDKEAMLAAHKVSQDNAAAAAVQTKEAAVLADKAMEREMKRQDPVFNAVPQQVMTDNKGRKLVPDEPQPEQ
jgi:hypothetical protein